MTFIGHISSHLEQETQAQGVSSIRRSSSSPRITFRARFLTNSGGSPWEAGHPDMQVLQLKQ
jgi:hypothetical protein